MVASCLVLFLGQSATWGQSLKIDAEIRTRGEYRAGFQKPLADSLHHAAVSLLRTRISALYEKDKVKAKVVLQDSRVYGQTGINTTNNSLGFYEAWGGYQFTPVFSFVLGRQSLEYDDKRLFSAANWSNTGNAHDLALLKFENLDGFKLHWGTAWNNAGNVLYESEYAVSKSYKMLNFLWLSKSFGSLGMTALWINDAFQQVIAIGEEKRCSRLSLEVRQDNVHAQALYRHLGFGEAEPPMYYWRKKLNQSENGNN